MKKTILSASAFREVESAHLNSYITGIIHPTRNMSNHDFIYFIEGEWEIYLDDVRYLPKKDDFIILPARVWHIGKLPCADGTKTYFIHITDDPHDRHASKLPYTEDEVELSTVINCRNSPGVKRLFEDIITTALLKEPYRKYKLDSLIRLLFIALRDADTGSRDGTGIYPHIDEVLRLIHASPSEFFTTPELAERCFVCPKTLVNHFRAYTGETPRKYQLSYKLGCIRAQLDSHPEIKLRELALSFGFYDEFYMSRMFKREFGTSPSEYKNKIKNS